MLTVDLIRMDQGKSLKKWFTFSSNSIHASFDSKKRKYKL